ncbi:MAG: glycosyltransferase [Treponemataceae bacterium]
MKRTNNDTHFIVKFHGGTANLLFQYAFYLKLKEDYPDYKLFVDTEEVLSFNTHQEKKYLPFFKINIINYFQKMDYTAIFEKNFLTFDTNKNSFFVGYWQDEKYFPKDMSLVYSIFSSLKLNQKSAKCLEKINQTNAVSIHVRRGDYLNNHLHGTIANKMYYNNAITLIKEKLESPQFFIFSDDIAWCKENLLIQLNEATFIEWNKKNVLLDILLMSKCNHNIISNSSFSWWGQFLNKNEKKFVITPEYWYNQKIEIAIPQIHNALTCINVPKMAEKKQNPFFSILIPVYNTEEYLRRCLSSVLNQSFDNFEVIIVNDASPDNAKSLLAEYAERDKRIKIINHSKNEGLLVARITGMEQATGDYILFLDSDDYFELTALEVLHKNLHNNPCDMLEFAYQIQPQKKIILPSYCKEKRVEQFLNFTDFIPQTLWNKAYKKQLVKKILTHIEKVSLIYTEDVYLSVIFSFFAEKINFFNESLLNYVQGIGITSYHTEDKIISNIEQIKKSTILLHNFFNTVDPSYLINLDQYQKKYEMSLLDEINRNAPLSKKLESFSIFKKHAQTNCFDNFIDKQEKWWDFACLSKKEKIKVVILFILKKIHLYGIAKKLLGK